MIIKKTARQYIHIELQNDVEKLLFILSKNTELLTSFFHQHLENFSEHIRKKKIIREKFSFKNIKPKSVLGFFVLIAFQFQYVIAQPLNALPTNGKVVAGAATISQTSAATNATMTVNQTSQRAVINWDSFNVGKNAAVNFVTPGANSSTLNRVTGASPSLIQGALSSNGQIILVNANGITFGRGAQVDAPGVVASTMDIANKDFMDGKSTFSGSGSGKIINKGTISATTQDGFIALLAPEVQNQGYLLASKGGMVVMAAGEQITLNFQGKHLGGVNVDIATYKALVANKRVVEVNGGLVVMAAGAANQLMSSVIKNSGRVYASSVVNNGGEIEFVGNTVTQAGTVEANSTTGVGGQVNLVGNNITATSKSKTTATGATGGGQVNMGLAQTAVSGGTQVNAVTPSANTAAINQAIVKANATQAAQNNSLAQTVTVEQGASIDASATQSGNGGIIAIWSALKTNIAGSLKAIGGAVSGNGGFVETSSKGTVILAPNAIINTSASNGKAGTWLLDPIDLTIDAATANIISAALENNNVSIAVNGNVCPSLGSCTQNGSGSLTIASGANILKATGSLSTLSLSSSGVFNLNANISGQNLNVIISSSIAYLNAGSSITANQVTVQAQTIYANGIINAQSGTTLGASIQLLAQAIYVSGGLNTSTSSNTNTSNTTNTSVTYNGNIIRKEDLPTFLTSQNNPNGNIASGLDVVYTSSAANDSSASAQTNTNQTNIIHLNAVNDLTIYSSAQILANGTNGGQITLSAQQLNAQSGSLIQANGNNGPGGVIAISGNQFNLDGTIAANGNDGGLISINAGSGALSLTGTVQANGSNGRGGTVIATQASDIQVNSATIQANGKTDGGVITLIADTGSINFTSALIQTNGSNGRGGSIGISAQNNVTLSSTKVDAIGLNQGGTIKIGNDASNGTLPFALSASLDQYSSINVAQLDQDLSNQNGGFIETSGQTLSMMASINAGRGGIWLLDPTNVTISTTAGTSTGTNPLLFTNQTNVSATQIQTAINAGTSVQIIADGSITQASNLTFAPASSVNVSLTYDTRTGTAQSIILTGTTTNTGAGNLTLNYLSSGQIIVNGAINSTSTGKINVVAESFYATNTTASATGANIYIAGNIATKGGFIALDGTGGSISNTGVITKGAIVNGTVTISSTAIVLNTTSTNTTTLTSATTGGNLTVTSSQNLAPNFGPNGAWYIGGSIDINSNSSGAAQWGFVTNAYNTTSPVAAVGNISITVNNTSSSITTNKGVIDITSLLTSYAGSINLIATTTGSAIAITSSAAISGAAGITIAGTSATAATIVNLGASTITNAAGNITITGNNSGAGGNTGISSTGAITQNANGGNITFTSNNIISQTGSITLAANTSGTASSILYDTRSGNKLSTISAGTFTLTSGSTSRVNYSILAAGAALTVNTVGVNGVITVNNTYGCASSPCTALTAVDSYITTANFSTLATTAANGITVSGALTGGTGVYLDGVTYSANHGVYSTVAIAATTGNIDVMGITNTGSGIWAQNSSATFTASAGNIIMNGYQFAGNAATNLNGVVTATLGSVTITGSNTTGNYAFWDNALITAATGISITGTSAPGNGNATISMSGAMTVTGVGAPITLIATNTANPGVAAIADTGAITGASGTNITFISNGIITQNGAITLAANTSGTASTVTYDTTSGNKAANITGGNLTIAAGSTSAINYSVLTAGARIDIAGVVSVPGTITLDNTYGCTGVSCAP
ncbi:filamentous hemagglutinin N-terminal domain-containing protein, partial [Polynucleobacter paneuropaeus]|nr:filamentous hemagglutinin N-terminal domain-containing protein [Polynucleobacter paneuropaeus]